MSVIRKKPFIESVLNTLTTSELSALKYVMNNGGNNVSVSLVSGSFEKGEGKIITSTITPVYLEVESNKFYSAILIWNASYCVAIPYHRFQDVKLIKINPSTRTYEEIKEYCDINELRRIIDDTAESSFDADGEAGQVLTADGEGGVQWKDNPQIIALTTNSGTLTSDQIALASAGNTVITLSGEYYYRFSKSDSAIVFKATPRVDSGTTYIDNITIDLSDNTYSASYETIAAGEGFTPTYDDELSDSSTNAVQNKVINAALAEKADVTDLEDYAKKDGNYPTMTVGAADNLTPYDEESGADQHEPFNFQATGTANGSQADFATGALALMKEKRGNSVVVNQLAKAINSTNWASADSSKGTVSFNGDEITYSIITAGSGFNNGITSNTGGITGKPDHTYVLLGEFKSNKNGVVKIGIDVLNMVNNYQPFATLTTSYAVYGVIINATNYSTGSGSIYICTRTITDVEEEDNFTSRNIILVDLTQWFGSNDLIPADLLAHPENFLRYYQGSLAYNEGQIVNANSRYIKCIGRQQWDEEVTSNYYWGGNGNKTSTPNYDASTNKIRVIPNRRYYFYKASGGTYSSSSIYVRYFDAQGNCLNTDANGILLESGSPFTIPANAVEMVFYSTFQNHFGNNPKITISLYYEGESGYDQYYPYEVLTNNDTGTETLLSAGNVADSKTPDGTITRKVGSVDLGALEWTYYATYQYFYAVVNGSKGNDSDNANIMCGIYGNQFGSTSSMPNMTMQLRETDHTLYVKNTSYTDAATFTTAMSGVKLNYELATPTTEQGTPFSENLIIDDFGSMEFSGTSGVPQGNLIFYPVDYKAFVDTLYDYAEGTPSDIQLKSELNTAITTFLTGITGYDATKTQVLKNIEGTLTWVDEENQQGE